MEEDKARTFLGIIRIPPGKNRQHGLAGGRPQFRNVEGRATLSHSPPRVYNTSRHNTWSQRAMLELRAQGWQTLPAGADYALSIELTIVAERDVDNPLEAILDLVEKALGINDRQFDELHSRRRDADPEEESYVSLRVTATRRALAA